MPKPDTAGRTFPVKRESLPTIAPDKKLPETGLFSLSASKDAAPKSRRDYWAIAFATLLIAAMLVLGWRIGKILLAGSSPVPKQNLSGMQTGSAVPKSALPKTTADNESKITKNSGLSTGQTNAKAKLAHTSPVISPKKVQSKLAADPVVIRALVGRDGKVQTAQVIHGNRRLSAAALATVRQLTFNPYAPHGAPLEFETEVTVSEAGARGSGSGIQFSIPRETPQPVALPIAAEKPSK